MKYDTNNAPIFTMNDYYDVLEYLKDAHVDRQMPVEFHNSIMVEGFSVILQTIYPEFRGYDYVEVYMNCHEVDVDVNDITLEFSPLVNGNAPYLVLNANETSINTDNEDVLSFTIDENYTATDHSQKLTGIETIKLDFNKDATGVEIINLLIKSDDFTYTLTDLDKFCFNGHDYVLRSLNDMANEKRGIQVIPELLCRYVHIAAAYIAWTTRWEVEAKAMKEDKSESNNYGDRLKGLVDSAIERYLSNIENNRNEEYIRMDLFQKAESRW